MRGWESAGGRNACPDEKSDNAFPSSLKNKMNEQELFIKNQSKYVWETLSHLNKELNMNWSKLTQYCKKCKFGQVPCDGSCDSCDFCGTDVVGRDAIQGERAQEQADREQQEADKQRDENDFRVTSDDKV